MDWSSFSLSNAAGFIKGPGKQFDEMLRSAATEIVVGSITIDPKPGNPGNVYDLQDDGTSVNALGLPNPGLEFIKEHMRHMHEQAVRAGKKLYYSVAGKKPEEYVFLAKSLLACNDRIELNLGCPNVWGAGKQEPIASFNLEIITEILEQLERQQLRQPFISVKLSPYSDPNMIPMVAAVLRRHHHLVKRVVTCNTFPNGRAMSGGKLKTDMPKGYGGVGGNAMHSIALGQVAQFTEELHGSGIEVVGVGGINSGERLKNMLGAGARSAQIGTHYYEHGAQVFSDILQEAV